MKIKIKTAYFFTPRKFSLDLVLKHLGIKTIVDVSDRGTMKAIKTLSSSKKPYETISIFFDDAEGIKLIEDVRLKHSVSSPFIVISFTTQDRAEKRFTTVSGADKPIIEFSQGTYHLKLPAGIDKLRKIVKEALPVEESDMAKIQVEYTFSLTYKRDAGFRHKCKNLASVIRILQGAYYAGDLAKPDYLLAIESIKTLSNETSALKKYKEIIENYLEDIDGEKQSLSDDIHLSKPAELTKVLLLDDEAVTAGWNIILDTIFAKRGYSIFFETDRERFIKEIEANEVFQYDILLLDLMMPDKPERSVYLIERMNDRHPHIPVIVFSALTDLPYYRKCQEAGAFNYFAKELGTEDRDPEKYYKKLKKLLINAAVYRKKPLKKYQKGYKNIVDGSPFYHTERINDTDQYSARFAYRVETVKGILSKQKQEKVDEINKRILSWFLGQGKDGKALSLRLKCFPEEKRMEIVFIGKVTGETPEVAYDNANMFSKELWDYLKMFSPSYRFVPIKNEHEFSSIVDAIEIESMFSLRRRKITQFENASSSIGSFEWFYPIQIMSGHNTNLITTVKQMMELKDTSLVGLTLTPCHNHDLEKKLLELNNVRDNIQDHKLHGLGNIL
ncbi:MAG: response regulator, partial [Nitrospinota bacterium]|nr:response regulator [Nitrospinota bacterium]